MLLTSTGCPNFTSSRTTNADTEGSGMMRYFQIDGSVMLIS